MNAGIPIGNIDPRGIQLFGRGKEVPLYIQGEADSVLIIPILLNSMPNETMLG